MITSFKYILNNTKNTYACKKAITISKKVTQNTTNKGNIETNDQITDIEETATAIDQTNPIKIFIKIWPESIFANKRTDKLITREK